MLKKMMLSTTIVTVLSACAATSLANPPWFNPHLGEILGVSSTSTLSTIAELRTIQWEYGVDLALSERSGEFFNCESLLTAIDQGFLPATPFEDRYVNATQTLCKTIDFLPALTSFSSSYLDSFTIDESLIEFAPPELAFLVNDHDAESLKTAKRWGDMVALSKTVKTNDFESIYYMTSTRTQTVTLIARGDYNGDDKEDAIVFIHNAIEGGAYTDNQAFILSRLGPNQPLVLLKSLYPVGAAFEDTCHVCDK